MYEFHDPSGRGRLASIAVLVWLAADLASACGSLMIIAALGGLGASSVAPETADSVAGMSSIALLAATLITMVLVSRWIMRVNANAHSFSDSMSITPGWNVGWFFVPIATFWKPFQGLRETWQASTDPHDPLSVPVPAVMRWWWGLWLVTSILGNISFRLSLGATTADTLIAASWIEVLSFAIDVPLAVVLIAMIRRFDELQKRGPDYAETFA
jgi:hypothetical protein